MKTPWYMQQKLPVVLVAGLGGFFTVVDLACAQPWATTDAPNLSWKALASSADGTKLVAAANTWSGYGANPPPPIYVSTNAGATWIQTDAPSNNWSSVACSADGVKLVAASTPYQAWDGTNWVYADGGAIYRSLDSGATWRRTSAPTNYWTSVASSADGAKLVAVANPYTDWEGNPAGEGGIYRSLDSGATWSRTSAPTNNWTSVACSADGAKLVAVAEFFFYHDWTWDYVGEGVIYTSSDAGVTWSRTSAPSNPWSCVASSAEGTKLVASTEAYYNGSIDVGDGLIYTSIDSGATWTATGAPRKYWTAVASSADGYRVVAGGLGTEWMDSPLLCSLPYSGPWRLADASANVWTSVASSAAGTKLVAVAGTDSGGIWRSIYTSSNSGGTWTPTSAPSNYWTSVASSIDGTKLVAVSTPDYNGDGLIYTSGNSGATWSRTSAPSNFWYSAACSADGTKVVAAAHPMIYTSSNSGVSWTSTIAPSNFWTSVASSADGAKLVAAGYEIIYTSSNSGVSWTPSTAPTNYWTSIASSADGARLVAVAAHYQVWNGTNYDDSVGGTIYTSPDSGATWTLTSAPTNNWTSVACSADGTKLVAAAGYDSTTGGDGLIYTSSNSGAIWTPADIPALASGVWWSSVASSSDGSNIVAVGDPGIWTLRSPAPDPPLPPPPQLAVGLSGANFGLSWLVPSTRFVLQQNSDLGSTNWVEVLASPTLDLTNLHQRLTLTPSLGSSFYRLKQQ